MYNVDFGFTFQIFIQNTMLQESQMNATDAIYEVFTCKIIFLI